MAKAPASQTRVYFDQYVLSGDLNASEESVTQELPDVTSFADAGPRVVVGNYGTAGSLNGFFDGASGAVDANLFNAIGAAGDHYLFRCYSGNTSGIPTAGSIGYEDVCQVSSEPRSARVGDAILLSVNTVGSDGKTRATVIGSQTVSGTGPLTGQNLGATTSGQKLAVTFRILSLTGAEIYLYLQESSDNGAGDAYADISGLVTNVAAAGVTRKTTTAATETWKRVRVAGTFSSALILVTVGVVAGTA